METDYKELLEHTIKDWQREKAPITFCLISNKTFNDNFKMVKTVDGLQFPRIENIPIVTDDSMEIEDDNFVLSTEPIDKYFE